MAFQVTSKKNVTDFVAIPKSVNSNFDAVGTSDPEFDLDNSDREKPSTEDI